MSKNAGCPVKCKVVISMDSGLSTSHALFGTYYTKKIFIVCWKCQPWPPGLDLETLNVSSFGVSETPYSFSVVAPTRRGGRLGLAGLQNSIRCQDQTGGWHPGTSPGGAKRVGGHSGHPALGCRVKSNWGPIPAHWSPGEMGGVCAPTQLLVPTSGAQGLVLL